MCVMRAVDPDGLIQKRGQRPVGKAVKPSRPHGPGDTSCKGVRRSVRHGGGEGGSGEGGICLLMRPAKGRCRKGNGPAVQLNRHTAIIQRRPANICSHDAKRGANCTGMILQRGERIIFLASFHNNDVTLSQFQVLVMLLQVSERASGGGLKKSFDRTL